MCWRFLPSSHLSGPFCWVCSEVSSNPRTTPYQFQTPVRQLTGVCVSAPWRRVDLASPAMRKQAMLYQTRTNHRIPGGKTVIGTIEQTTMRKVYWHVLPIAAASYFFCYLDRINVGFAALTMNKDLGLDAATFGFAAGVFFWGYFLFEVPSNIIMEKLGARIWIARIMVTWGLLSGATAFCTGPYSFMTVRFLLGLAEAGFYPGLVLFFTYWFPDRHRARIVSGFTLALPVAVAAGAPMSTGLMELNG